MCEIRFDNQVAVITGAAQGLGIEYVRLLASRGAAVVINDIAADDQGETLAQKLVEEIVNGGGNAVASTDNIASKEGAAALIKKVTDSYGKVDIFIHNAGVMRSKPFLELEENDWYDVMNVHLNGAYHLLKGIIPLMQKKNYGRIVMITSSVGMYGLGNHSSYAAAKMGVYGLVQSLKLELEGTGIACNLVSPLAATGQTSYALHEGLRERLAPKLVAPLVAYLCSEACQHNGATFVAGGGYFSSVGFLEGDGIYLSEKNVSSEAIGSAISQILDLSSGVQIASTDQAAKKIFKKIFKSKIN